MADRTASVFKIIQSYGGLKTAYIEVADIDSDDVLLLTGNGVKRVEYVDLCEEDDTNGRAKLSFAVDAWGPDEVSPTYANKLTLKTAAKEEIKVSGIIMWREY